MNKSGFLKFVHGTMGSGKTARLIIDATQCIQNNGAENVAIICNKLSMFRTDIDGDSELIRSRIGISIKPTHYMDSSDDMSTILQPYIFVDEINFFSPDQVDQLKTLSMGSTKIYVYGLAKDFMSFLFASSARCIELADDVEKLQSPKCFWCSNMADIDHLSSNSVHPTLSTTRVDGRYVSTCWTCWKKCIQ